MPPQSYQEDSLRPVTIKQILEAQAIGDSDFSVDGQRISQITVVGQVRNIHPAQTLFTVRLDDGTGQIDVKHFIDIDRQEEATSQLSENMHVRIFGRCKAFGGKHMINAHILRPVTNFDEINYHMLEANYVHLHYTKGPLGGGGAKPKNQDGGGDSMFVDGGAGAGDAATQAKLGRCSASARKMYSYLSKVGGNEGQHLQLVSNGAAISVRDVLGAAEELLHQGLIYTTVDDETWAILDY